MLVNAALAGLITPTPGHAETATNIEEVVVTAQKQRQAANTVGMSLTTATGDTLRQRGINSVLDLTRLVSGLTIQHSAFNSTSFTLRGVGFFNSDLATPAAVTVYVDEAPLPFPAMTKLVAFDLARVEVLKGPQGTLFGENATGGAVNYIAAKPTETFVEGVDATYGRFNRFRIGGFVGGPINDELSFRVALQVSRGGPWQQSITRPGDGLGRIDDVQARATLDWHPTESFDSRLTFTTTHDGSETEAAQFIHPLITIPALSPGLATFPIVTKPRAADWAPVIQGSNQPFPYASDTNLYHLTWRNDLQLANDITVTSLTSVAQFHMNYAEDPDGTPLHMSEEIDRGGRVSSYFEELRATGGSGKLDWLVGGNIEHESTRDNPVAYNIDNSVSHVLQSVDPAAIADTTQYTSHLRASTYGVFARLQYNITDQLSLEGALRYSQDNRTFDNCAIATTDAFVRFWNHLPRRRPAVDPDRRLLCARHRQWLATGEQCPQRLWIRTVSRGGSARIGLCARASCSTPISARATKPARSRCLPPRPSRNSKSVPQESLLAYETGIKASLLDDRLQINAAAFYYDYADKQLRGAELDPNFGPLQALSPSRNPTSSALKHRSLRNRSKD